MDIVSNEGVNSNSVLENTRDTQKNYQDVYAALDASVVTGNGVVPVGVDVEIGQKSFDESSKNTTLTPASSSRLSISNVAQATVAPELRDLRAGQNLHNRLQTASAALEGIRTSIEDISDQIGAPQNYLQNPTVRGAVENINKIASETMYGGKTLFNTVTLYNDKPAIDVPEISEIAEKEYSQIQSTIMANAERVVLDSQGAAMTKGSEVFIVSQSNSEKLYSFPKNTPLDDINKVIEDSTEDPSIRPLVYFENRGGGEVDVVTKESQGPVEFASEVTVSSIDGELFAVPLDTYSKERNGSYSQRDGRIVDTDNSLMAMSEELGQNSPVQAVNLSEENVSEVRVPNEVQVDRPTLTRYDNFNERLGESVREGDGFAVTPQDPGASSGSLTAGSALRDSAKSGSQSNGFNGAVPEGSDDVMLLPEENTTEPYVTLQEREAGLNGTESLDQESKALNTIDSGENYSTTTQVNPVLKQVQNGVLGGEAVNTVANIQQDTEAQPTTLALSSNPAIPAVSESNSQSGTQSDSGSEQGQAFTGQNNSGNNQIALSNIGNGARPQSNIGDQGVTDVRSDSPVQQGQIESQALAGSLAELGATPIDRSTNDDDERAPSLEEQIVSYGVNPIRELEGLQGYVNRTMSFTLRGERGEMDFVIAAGVRVDALSLAINTTSDVTGVSANAANGSIALVGAESSQLERPEMDSGQYAMPDVQSTSSGAGAQGNVSEGAAINNESLGDQSVSINRTASELSDGLELNIDLENFGATEGRSQVYSINSFAQDTISQELSQSPELARRILASATRQIDTLQSNIESLSSVNIRNTIDASDRIEEKILQGVGAGTGIQSSDESAEALNRVAVGINNTTSAEGGRGYGDNPIASLNLLGSVDNQSVGDRNLTVEADLNNPAYRLATAQAAVTYGVDRPAGSLEAINRAEATVSEEMQASEVFAQNNVSEGSPVLERLAQSLERAREGLEEIRQVFDIGVERRENIEDLVQRGTDRFFSNIENASATIREQGRENERELFDKNMVEEEASQKLYSERQVQLGTAPESRVNNGEIITPSERTAELMQEEMAGQEIDSFASQVSDNVGQDIAPTIDQGDERASAIDRGEEVEEAPAVVMSSIATPAPVAVTSSAQESVAQPTQQEANTYKSMTTLLEGKIGTVVVHGQDYTMKDIEGRIPEMLQSEPEIVQTVVDKAIKDVEEIVRDVADLQTQELEELGGALMAAIDTYGSDQSASKPAVFEHAAYVRG